MSKIKVIDFELKKYEKELLDIVSKIGIDEFEQTYFEIQLTLPEIKLLSKSTKYSIDILEGLRSEGEMFEDAYWKQIKLSEILDDTIYNKVNLYLTPLQHEWPLISLEIGGKINLNSRSKKNEVPNIWKDKEYKLLVEMFDKILNKYKIIINILSPFEIPEYLKD